MVQQKISSTPLDFVIIGAQKAGSTFLHEALRSHPHVYMPRFETPYFESPFYEQKPWSDIVDILQDGQRSGQICGIKRPDYLTREECPLRIAEMAPRAKLIVSLREPISRAISAYFWYVQVGLLPAEPLNDAFEKLLDGTYQATNPNASEILSFGRYATAIQNYLTYFDRSQLLILLQDDLLQDPQAELKRICNFLGIDADQRMQIAQKPKRAIYAPARLKWRAFANRQFFYRADRQQNGYLVLAQRENKIAQLAYYTSVAVDRLVLKPVFKTEKPQLNQKNQERLSEYYKPEVLALESLLGQRIPNWHFFRAGD